MSENEIILVVLLIIFTFGGSAIGWLLGSVQESRRTVELVERHRRMTMNEIIETPVTEDPYSLFAGICAFCGKWIHWAELHLIDEVGLEMYHIDCDCGYLDF